MRQDTVFTDVWNRQRLMQACGRAMRPLRQVRTDEKKSRPSVTPGWPIGGGLSGCMGATDALSAWGSDSYAA